MIDDKTEVKKSKIFPGCLYLVSTPIGNLGDITLRAMDILSRVDFIACEDTRVTGKLLESLAIKKRNKLISYNDHNAKSRISDIMEKLEQNNSVALVSDAGTPLISDPGYRLVSECREKAIKVSVIPGASAPISALLLSGFACDKFSFLGFFPRTEPSARKILEDWRNIKSSLIFFESPSRLLSSLKIIDKVMGSRKLAIAREITKLYEETICGNANEIITYFEEKGSLKGEIVIVISPPEDTASRMYKISPQDEERIKKTLIELMKTKTVKDSVAEICLQENVKKSIIYDMAVSISRSRKE